MELQTLKTTIEFVWDAAPVNPEYVNGGNTGDALMSLLMLLVVICLGALGVFLLNKKKLTISGEASLVITRSIGWALLAVSLVLTIVGSVYIAHAEEATLKYSDNVIAHVDEASQTVWIEDTLVENDSKYYFYALDTKTELNEGIDDGGCNWNISLDTKSIYDDVAGKTQYCDTSNLAYIFAKKTSTISYKTDIDFNVAASLVGKQALTMEIDFTPVEWTDNPISYNYSESDFNLNYDPRDASDNYVPKGSYYVIDNKTIRYYLDGIEIIDVTAEAKNPNVWFNEWYVSGKTDPFGPVPDAGLTFNMKKVQSDQTLFIKATQDNTSVSISKHGSYDLGVSYSTSVEDGFNKAVPTSTGFDVCTLNAGESVGIVSSTDGTVGTSNYINFVFNQPVEVYGNIMGLITEGDADDASAIPYEYCFYKLFQNCPISSVSENILSATTLKAHCYASMFEGCTNLSYVPWNIWPAYDISLLNATACFKNMFKDSSVEYLDWNMLPMTILSSSCYEGMFSGCENVHSVASWFLPATVLKEGCYKNMFANSGVEYLPVDAVASDYIPAAACFQGMFEGCENLWSVEKTASGRSTLLTATDLTNAPNCYASMFKNSGMNDLANLTLPAMTLSNGCYANMFENCTNITGLPNNYLPAQTLAEDCYSEMFKGCTGLSSAIVLPATTLVAGCYNETFSGCSLLNNITVYFESWNEGSSTLNWVKDVSPTGTFTIMNYVLDPTQKGDSYIPESWDVI